MNSLEERFPRLWALGERVSVLVAAGLLFFLCSLLVITIPATLVGLIAAIAPLVRPTGGEVVIRFWRAFRRTFGRALLLGLIDLALGLLLWVDYQVVRGIGTPVAVAGSYLFVSLGFVAALANVFAWPLLAWYPQPLAKLLKLSLLMAGAYPFRALAGLAVPALLVLLFWLLPGPAKALVVLLGPGLGALGLGAAAWSAMKQHAGPDDEFAE